MAPVAPSSSSLAFLPPAPLRRPRALRPAHRLLTSPRRPKRPRAACRRRVTLPLARAAPYPPPPPEPLPDDPVQLPCVVGAYRLERLVARQPPYLYYDAVPVNTSAAESADACPPALTVKLLSLHGLSDWRALDALRREAAVQATVQHPSVPQFVEFLEHDTDTDALHLLVTARPPCLPLHDFAKRFRLTPPHARAVADQLLEVLADLAALSPPVAHGAVSPYTVFLEPAAPQPPVSADETTGADEAEGTEGTDETEDKEETTEISPPPPPPPRLMLAGIGASPALSAAGPFFVAPERSLAPGASDSDSDSDSDDDGDDDGTADRIDLYAAGATLYYLVTGRRPPGRDDAPSFAPGLRAADPRLVAVLTELLRRDATKRPASAAAALAALRDPASLTESGLSDGVPGDENGDPFFMRADIPYVDAGAAPVAGATPALARRDGSLAARPGPRGGGEAGSARVEVQAGARGRRLRVAGTPAGFSGGTAGRLAYATMWTSIVAAWTGGVVASGGLGFAMALFSVPFWRVSAGMVQALAREVRGGGELRLCAGEPDMLRRRARRRVGEPDLLRVGADDDGMDAVRVADADPCARADGAGVATLTVQRVVGRRIELRGALGCVGGAGVAETNSGDGGFAVEIEWEGRRVRLVNGVPWSQATRACKAVNEFLETHAPDRPLRWDGAGMVGMAGASAVTGLIEASGSEPYLSDNWELWDSAAVSGVFESSESESEPDALDNCDLWDSAAVTGMIEASECEPDASDDGDMCDH